MGAARSSSVGALVFSTPPSTAEPSWWLAQLSGTKAPPTTTSAPNERACLAPNATAARAEVALESGASMPIVNSKSTEYLMRDAEVDVLLDTV